MADGTNGGGIGPLAFIVGGLVVAVGIGAFAYTGGHLGGNASSITTEKTVVAAPATPGPAATTTTTTTQKTTK